MSMTLGRSVAMCAAIAVLLASPAGAQTVHVAQPAPTAEQERDRCANASRTYGAEAQIRACSSLLRAPHVSDRRRAHLLNNRGNGFRGAREFGRAIVDYDEAIRLNPAYANAYNNRGIAYRAAGAPDLAIADFSRALELDPNAANVYTNRGSAHADKGDLARAIADYTRAIELDP